MIKTWYNIAAKGEAEAEISIYDAIGKYDINAKQFAEDLKGIDAETIHLRINSPGGSVVDGNAIYNALKRHPAKVITHIDGMAASMASVLAMAGDEVLMSDNALLMIHNPWTVSIGDAEALRKDADLLEKMETSILSAYSRSHYSAEELKELMNEETWMTASEALEAGFIDSIENGLKAAASFINEAEEIAGFKVPVEKQLQAVSAQAEKLLLVNAELSEKVSGLESDLEAASKAKDEADALCKLIESELEDKAEALESMEKEIESLREITPKAIAQKAAEILQVSTVEPVSEIKEEEPMLTQDQFWAEYKKVGLEKGSDAKNEWYQKNKHRKI